jgi:hypothetical protein
MPYVASGLLSGPTGAEVKPRKKLAEWYIWSMALYGAETWDISESRSEITWKF